MKKYIPIILAILLFPAGVSAGTIAAKYVNTPILIDGQAVKTTVYNINDKTYTSARDIAEALGAKVGWENGQVIIESPKTDLETVVAATKNSCVMIYVYKDDKKIGQGSGWAYNGYIITAKHVADAGDKYAIFADNSTTGTWVTRVSLDTTLDVAVLSSTILPSVKLGDSSKLIEGEKLVSITSPKGAENLVDQCTYSGMLYDSKGDYMGITDTLMTGGSSGGAVFNMKGELSAMTINSVTDVAGEINAIPVNDLKPILSKLK